MSLTEPLSIGRRPRIAVVVAAIAMSGPSLFSAASAEEDSSPSSADSPGTQTTSTGQTANRKLPKREAVAEIAEEWSDAAQGVSEGAGIGVSHLSGKRHNEILREKMRALATEHPQLVEALRKRLALQKAFESERRKRLQ